jgi:hypothetical protein
MIDFYIISIIILVFTGISEILDRKNILTILIVVMLKIIVMTIPQNIILSIL